MTLDIEQAPPLAKEFYEGCKQVNPRYAKIIEESMERGEIPEILGSFWYMVRNLGHDRYKAFDMAYRYADEDNLKVLEKMTGGITKKMWGTAFWGWGQ